MRACKFIHSYEVGLGVMLNTDFWFLLPTIEIMRCPVLRIDVYIRFLCFSLDFYIHK